VPPTRPVIYRLREGSTAEDERIALASVYAFILQRHQEKQKGGAATAPDARKESNGSGNAIIPKHP
jgi:hypothetical protein